MVKKISIVIAALTAIGSATQAGSINRDAFYAACEKSRALPPNFFKGRQRDGIERILDYWGKTDYEDARWLAYILGTAYRESAGTMQPVREGLCKNDKCSIDAVTAHFGAKNISSNYALPDKEGNSYFGRGLVQLTHKTKYKSVGQALGWGSELVAHPNLALDPDKATINLVEGMAQGLFTRCSLPKSFGAEMSKPKDWISARCIVNPGSKRAQITADHALAFYACLEPRK